MVGEIDSSHQNRANTNTKVVRSSGSALNPNSTQSPAEGSQGDAHIRLSDLSKRMSGLEKLAHDAPDVDQSRVQNLKEQIENESYQVDTKNLAQKIIQTSTY